MILPDWQSDVEDLAHAGVPLTFEQVEALAVYEGAVIAANEKFNLVARGPGATVRDHIIDSLSLIATGKFLPGRRCCDIGSGAGFPGLPIKIVIPELELLLIEANIKKASFLQKVIAEQALSGVEVFQGRAEEAGREARWRESMDVVFSRAVATLPVLLEYGLPLTRVGGCFLAMKGPKAALELGPGKEAAQELGGRLEDAIELPGLWSSRGRAVVFAVKVAPGDERYPRRAGIPKKRPLGGRS